MVDSGSGDSSNTDDGQNRRQDPDTDGQVSPEEIAEFDLNWAKLKSARHAFNKAAGELREFLATNPAEDKVDEAQVRLEDLEELWSELNEHADRIYVSPCAEENFRKRERESRTDLKSIFHEISRRLKIIISRANRAEVKVNDSRREELDAKLQFNSTLNSEARRAPRMDFKELVSRIPKFEGDATKFSRWKDAFELHVDSKPWGDLEKFELLLKTIGGKVQSEISGWRVGAENYSRAKEAIFKRFGKSSLAEEQHADNIFEACERKDLQVPGKFINFASCIIQNVESLATLGHSYEGMSIGFASKILNSFPYEQRRRYDDGYLAKESQCKLRNLVEFLTDERQKLESLAMSRKSHDSNQKQDGKSKSSQYSSYYKKSEHRKSGSVGPNSVPNSEFSFAVASPPADHSCVLCGGDHPSLKCKRKMSVEEKRKCVVTQNACFKCLLRNHKADKCRQKSSCSTCGARHATILCTKPKRTDTTTSAAVTVPEEATTGGDSVVCNAVSVSCASKRSLPTGYVVAQSNTVRRMCRVVLDTGSQKTLISARFASAVEAEVVGRDSFLLQSAGYAVPKECVSQIVELNLKSRFSENNLTIRATVLPCVIEGQLPNVVFSGKLTPIADRNDGKFRTDVDLLIGVDFLYHIVGVNTQKVNGFIAFDTIFGYFLCGIGNGKAFKVNHSLAVAVWEKRQSWPGERGAKVSRQSAAVSMLWRKYDSDDVSFLWDTETLGIEPYYREKDEAEDEECSKFFSEMIKRSPSGRYVMKLPFKPNRHKLGLNRKLVENRLRSFLLKAKQDPKFLQAVDKEIAGLIEQGFVEHAEPMQPGQEGHYLPLLVVKKAGSTPSNLKVRVVHDAGARSKDEAGLNDTLYQGANLIPCILSVLLKFRQLKIPICADVEKAYLQFEIDTEHRKFLKFLWPLGISVDPKAPIRELQSCRLAFGLVSAPWLHCAGIRHHLDNEIRNRPQDKELLEFVKQNFYIDDLIGFTANVEQGKKVIDTLVAVFAAGKFPLSKWATASPNLGKYIQKKYPKATVSFENENLKFLGIRWNQREDSLHIDVSTTIEFMKTCVPSKRTLLKALASIYDPAGLIGPITIAFRMQLQRLWVTKLSWDSVLSGHELVKFRENASNLTNAASISVNRNFGLALDETEDVNFELHVFCDASLTGYGCVAYVRKVYNNSRAEVTFVLSKGRVAPLKGEWSIHRLELLGAIVAVRIAKKIRESLIGEFSSTTYWCDNACVLSWVRDKPERWKKFVELRIREIQDNSNADQWRYIRSKENPCDVLSRSAALDSPQLRDFWLSGPSWLRSMEKPESHSLNPETVEVDVTNEMRAHCVVGTVVNTSAVQPIGLKAFSSWSKVVRVVVYMRRWLSYKRNAIEEKPKFITADEFFEAEIAVIKNIQARSFSAEIKSNFKNMSKNSQIFQFNPMLNTEGLVICRSRLQRADDLSSRTKNPIILPGEDELVDLYLRWLHEHVCYHAGSALPRGAYRALSKGQGNVFSS